MKKYIITYEESITYCEEIKANTPKAALEAFKWMLENEDVSGIETDSEEIIDITVEEMKEDGTFTVVLELEDIEALGGM